MENANSLNPGLKTRLKILIKSHFKIILLTIGIILLIGIFSQVPWMELIAKITQISLFGMMIIVMPRYLSFIGDTLVSHRIFHQLGTKLRFWDLLLVRTSTEPLQFVLPGGNVAAEPTRIMMLNQYGTTTDKSAGGFILLRLALTIASVIFNILGVAGAIIYFGFFNGDSIQQVIEESGVSFYISVISAFALLIIVVMVVILIIRVSLKEGIFTFFARKVQSIGFLRTRLEKHKEIITQIDDTIRGFHQKTGKRFLLLRYSMYLLATYLVYFFELYFILTFLGFEVTLIGAFILQSFGLAVQNCTKIIPAGIGAQEGGFYLVYAMLGFQDPLLVATSYALLVRGVEIFWIVFGSLHFGYYSLINRKKV